MDELQERREIVRRQKEIADAIILERAIRVLERRYPSDREPEAWQDGGELLSVKGTLRHAAIQLREGWGVHVRG